MLQIAETKIRQAVIDGYVNHDFYTAIEHKIREIIKTAITGIKNAELRKVAPTSLMAFARRQMSIIRQEMKDKYVFFFALLMATGQRSKPINVSGGRVLLKTKAQALKFVEEVREREYPVTLGVPLKKFSNDYFNKDVRPVVERLSRETAIDPDDISGRNSLRNRAEMEVRYADHIEQLARLRAKGVKLVIASTHADCSDRCSRWQGRVYSLDGTSGTTKDGRRYVPIEEATDVIYRTKAGKIYKNGLLGFNCRHYLVEYKDGLFFPKVTANMQQRESVITERQRAYERRIRALETKRITAQSAGAKTLAQAYAKAKNKANQEYIEFCKVNNRPYYPSRTKIA